MVVLVTSDSEQFKAEREVVERSVLIKNMLEGLLKVVPRCPAIDCLSRCRRVRSANSSSKRIFQRNEEGNRQINECLTLFKRVH